jgi:hypothetical protein
MNGWTKPSNWDTNYARCQIERIKELMKTDDSFQLRFALRVWEAKLEKWRNETNPK